MSDNDTVPCGLCGQPTAMAGTRRCDRCWELETRIKSDPELALLIITRLMDGERAAEDRYADEHASEVVQPEGTSPHSMVERPPMSPLAQHALDMAYAINRMLAASVQAEVLSAPRLPEVKP